MEVERQRGWRGRKREKEGDEREIQHTYMRDGLNEKIVSAGGMRGTEREREKRDRYLIMLTDLLCLVQIPSSNHSCLNLFI